MIPFTLCLSNSLFLLGNNPDLLERIEGLVGVWTKQIEQVLAESEQVSPPEKRFLQVDGFPIILRPIY